MSIMYTLAVIGIIRLGLWIEATVAASGSVAGALQRPGHKNRCKNSSSCSVLERCWSLLCSSAAGASCASKSVLWLLLGSCGSRDGALEQE